MAHPPDPRRACRAACHMGAVAFYPPPWRGSPPAPLAPRACCSKVGTGLELL